MPLPLRPAPRAAPARPGLGSGRELGGGPAGRAAGALTPVLRSSVPPLAAESLVVLRPTSEGSVWDIQLVIMAMVLSTTPILSSGTDIAPGTPPAPAPRWRRLRAPGSLQAAGTAAGRGARPCPRAPSARRRPPAAAAVTPRAPAIAAPLRAPGRVAASPLPAVRCRPPARRREGPPAPAPAPALSAARAARGGRGQEAGTRPGGGRRNLPRKWVDFSSPLRLPAAPWLLAARSAEPRRPRGKTDHRPASHQNPSSNTAASVHGLGGPPLFHPQGRRPARPGHRSETPPADPPSQVSLSPAAGDLLGGGSRPPPAPQAPKPSRNPDSRTLGSKRSSWWGSPAPVLAERAKGSREAPLGVQGSWDPAGLCRQPWHCPVRAPGSACEGCGHAAAGQELGVGWGLRPPSGVAYAAPPRGECGPGGGPGARFLTGSSLGLWGGGSWCPGRGAEGHGRLAQLPSPWQHPCQDM